jgi:sialate O-acetylesterase
MRALIGGWRQVWKQGDISFYWVQLANFQRSDPNKPEMGDGWAKHREGQLKSLSIPNTGMAVIMDIGAAGDIHPKNKQDVGKRLAAWALAKDFGKKVECSGPLYRKCQVEGNKIRIEFDHAESGLMVGEKKGLDPVQETADGKVKWISIAGEDKKFYWAEAAIDGKTLVVSSDKVPNPVAVRYAFAMNPQGANLYNKDGLPASPFRTDNW